MITPTIPGREKLLEECGESVARQTYPAIQHYVQTDHGHHGPALVRNSLVGQTKSDWVLPLDDDDTLDPGCVAALVAASRTTTADGSVVDYDVTYSWCRMIGRTDNWTPNRLFAEFSLYRQNFIPNCALIRRSLFEVVGGYRNVQLEDWDMWIRMVQHGARFRCLPEVTWTYRAHEGQNFQRQAA